MTEDVLIIRFTDVIDVIQAITMHPDHEVAKSLKIGAVTCCIDPLNTFMENRSVKFFHYKHQ